MTRKCLSLQSTSVGLLFFLLVFASVGFCLSPSSFLSDDGLPVTQGMPYQKNFTSIQHAINEAENGSTIHVPSGVYYEHVIINKTVSLIGAHPSTTIIDGSNSGTVVSITVDNVSITDFTIQNSGWGWVRNGVYIRRADNCRIENNSLINNCHNIRLNYSSNSQVLNNVINEKGYGIRLISSVNCTVRDNIVSNCIGGVHLQNATECTVERNRFTQNSQGIRMYSPCTYNRILANVVYNNTYDGMIEAMPGNTTYFSNYLYHNNFVNNLFPFIYAVTGNIWDNDYPSGGNYWSRYNGTDLFSGIFQNESESDGIGDLPYSVNAFESDRYPLMSPWAISLVQNIDTGMSYHSIQEAIDTIETLGGHTLRVDPGIYHEHVNIHKPLTIIGENCTTTIIDGNHIGTVLHVTADNVSISGFSIRNSGSHFPPYGDDCGVLLDHVSGVSFKHNRITNNRIGVYLFFSSGNSLEYNNVSSNDENGIWLWYSGGNTLVDNHILNNSYNFGVFGGTFSDFNNTITKGNTVDGKPIYYLIGAEDEILDDQTNIGVLYLINCHNMTVRDLRFSKNGQGILYYGGTSSRIENVTVLDSNYGIHIQGSNNTIIRNNRCSRNWVGILLLDSSNNLADSNIVERGEKGVSLYEASENILRENTLLNNLYGFRLYSSHSNELYHNNLIGNSEHANCLFSYQNTWDNGFEGNFWGSFVGSDIVKDGLGDSPHNIDGNNRDLYPLLGMFQNFTLQHENETHSISLISNSTIHHIALESNGSAIRLTVNGTDGTYGFCRISIPHAFLEPEFSILIDNRSSEVLYANYTLLNDGFRSWIYFVYNHSTHEIIIIPEYFPFTILLILICTTYYICWMRQKYKRRP